MGFVTGKPRSEDNWQIAATQAAIEACREVVGKDGINGRAMISSLSEVEWGWIVAAAIFAWIKTRAQQAVAEGSSYDLPIRSLRGRDPKPWEAGAVETVLPALGEMVGIDWEQPLGLLPKDQIISLAWQMHRLVSSALANRDQAVSGLLRIDRDRMEREASAAAGGSLMSRAEMNDDIPF